MIKLIAHRALFDGPNPELENRPEQILDAIGRKFEVEVDVWLKDGEWWLGHDAPTYKVNWNFLSREEAWLHAKNHEALYAMLKLTKGWTRKHVFWHDQDAFTLTSSRVVWAYPGQPLTDRTVWVQPEWDADWREKIAGTTCYGICSKHVAEIRQMIR